MNGNRLVLKLRRNKMELDKRIKEGKRPLTCFDTEQAKQFIGKECYLSDGVASFANIDNLNKAMLMEVEDEDMHPYKLENTRWHYGSLFILPCEWVKSEEPEKKYRPFKDHTEYKEYLNDGIIESWIQIREKLTGEVSELMYVGGSGAIICLGAYSFDLNNLFYDFELFNESTGEWQPFGVLDNGEK